MSHQRSLLYAAAATRMVVDTLGDRAVIVDGWAMTSMAASSGRGGTCGEHIDDLYCGKGRGFISRAISNEILGAICADTS